MFCALGEGNDGGDAAADDDVDVDDVDNDITIGVKTTTIRQSRR